MSLIVKAAAYVTGRLWTRWEKLCADPATAQNRLLLDIIQRNRATAFGKDHGFAVVRSLEEYRKQVAIGDYERRRPYVERAADGKSQVLTEEPVSMFTLTSGSTGAPKLIPVTATSLANHRRLTRLWYYRANLDHPGLFNNKMLGVVSPAREGNTAGNIPFGAASGLIYQSSPRWIQNAFALPYEIAEVKDFAAKYYLIMRLALEQPISFLGTPNPSTILRLVESADRAKDEIIRAIRDGTIGADCYLTASIRRALEPRLKKNPSRAAELERMVNHHGALRPMDYWPELRMIGCWKGGSVAVRLNELSLWFGDGMPVRDLGYMASEAQMTLPVSDSGSAGILDVSANFYEFIAENEIDNARPAVLTCAELREGANYYLILTTPGGLYRYDIND
ncbi:MAG TPA: GH3 auxin-responsive promoter family protein, partial [Candidatus Binatia bacterium]